MEELNKKMFYDLLRTRIVEEEIARLYPEQEMRCPVHLSVGQEATPVGLSACLSDQDYAVSTHRAHAHYLAKGGNLKALISELYGRETGCTGGQGGSMHLIDLKVNFLASTSIVGGTIPIGVGSALTSKLKGENRVTVIYIGDTAVEEGVFHESMNFAALKKLPVFFCCENNNYSCYSPLKNRQPDRPLMDVAKAHGIKHVQIDGNDVYAVYNESKSLIDEARAGKGPVFVEYKTFRYLEHCGPHNDDSLCYRLESELQWGKQEDAIEKARQNLINQNLYSKEWEAKIRSEILNEVHDAFAFAKASSYPPQSHLGAYTYAPAKGI